MRETAVGGDETTTTTVDDSVTMTDADATENETQENNSAEEVADVTITEEDAEVKQNGSKVKVLEPNTTKAEEPERKAEPSTEESSSPSSAPVVETNEEPPAAAMPEPAAPEPVSRAVAQERADSMAKQRARGTSRMGMARPGVVTVGAVAASNPEPSPAAAAQPPVDNVQQVVSQQEADLMAKNRARGSFRGASSVMAPGAAEIIPPSAQGSPVDTVQQQQEMVTQEDSDRLAKNRARGSNRRSPAAPIPGAVAVVPPSSQQGPPDVDHVQKEAVSQEQESEAQAKNRGRRITSASSGMAAPGAVSVTPPTQDTTSSDDRAVIAQVRADATSKAQASAGGAEEPRISRAARRQAQTEEDRAAKNRARGGAPAVTATAMAGPPVKMESVEEPSGGVGGLDEMARRREERAQARAERRGGRNPVGAVSVASGSSQQSREDRKMARESTVSSADSVTVGSSSAAADSTGGATSSFSNMSENERTRRYNSKMVQMDQTSSSITQSTNPANGNGNDTIGDESTMADDERQRRYDAKIGNAEQQHEDNKEKRSNLDPSVPVVRRNPPTAPLQPTSGSEKNENQFRNEGFSHLMSHPPVTTTADRGVAVAPDVEYGEYTQPIVEDNDLAVAIAIDEEEEEEDDKLFAYAVEFDPDSKPPLYQNRRFRLYGIGGAVCFVVLTIVLVVAIVSTKDEGTTTVLTLAPTSSPTMSPTSARESVYKNYFSKEVSPTVLEPGTPHFSAAQWIMNEDPMQLEPTNPNLLQRYMMAFLWFHTTENGATEWRSCNPPKDGEDDTCEFLEFTRRDNDTIAYVPRQGRTRWLSGQGECSWVGVECAGGSAVLGFRLFGQKLTGTLPTEVVALPFLQRISVPYNELTGTLPPEYAKIKHLLDIEVHGNALTGPIPSEYFEKDTTTLANFNIGDNFLSGTLDTRVGLMSDLKGLHIFENNLEGNFPTEVGNLNYLSFSRVNGNEFTGPVPTQLGRLGQLSELWYHENLFTGPLPSELGRLYRLQDFRLWGNQLTGTIPDELFSMRKLKRFSVREMTLTGTLSTLVGQMTDLQQLEVSTNQLTGRIPSEIQSIAPLRLSWLHCNQFTGQVPDGICNLVRPGGLEFLQADCHPTEDPPNPCRCCSACCDRVEQVCLANDLSGKK